MSPANQDIDECMTSLECARDKMGYHHKLDLSGIYWSMTPKHSFIFPVVEKTRLFQIKRNVF